ncbi:phosphate signaling complex protein PhoU [Clostridium cylindrosporum]|uniref:Phosphate-specific transport system accessory protein PhoU n=1 Tax=Clostridium cylindrosporum DSM 605 TaxID=1121307 RepID=A0A0J8DDY3_CLOCY|nr:phosphate signaling complex protein PhoU [Clostridium cylindrosporum]KMT22439.1 phosphate-specific transport system accessory protein PhoU [Clostridium cylindrosporum DSM 605]
MSREHYSQKLLDVKHKVLTMGSMVENVINMSVNALKSGDIELAKRVYEEDDKIDLLEIEIEQECMTLLLLESPLAKDLRIVLTALKLITDLERMGDHAVNIAKITLEIGEEPLIKPLIDIPKMAEICQDMVRLSLDAFVKEDITLAENVAQMDEQIDTMYENIVEELFRLIAEHNDNIKQGTKLLFVGRFLERIADHTTNICERLVYMVTGERQVFN